MTMNQASSIGLWLFCLSCFGEDRVTVEPEKLSEIVASTLARNDVNQREHILVTTKDGKGYQGFLDPILASSGEIVLRNKRLAGKGVDKTLSIREIATLRVRRKRSGWTNSTWVASSLIMGLSVAKGSEKGVLLGAISFVGSSIFHIVLALRPKYYVIEVLQPRLKPIKPANLGGEADGDGCGEQVETK
jgi:hypothetical protein